MGIEEDGRLNVSFLREKSLFTKDTFTFPDVEDITMVHPGQSMGVPFTRKGSTHRQTTLVKVLHPFTPLT